MKKEVLITCSQVIPEDYLNCLKNLFNARIAGCNLVEEELMEIVKEINGLIMGGEEIITLEALKRSNLEWIIFIGSHSEAYFSPDAWNYAKQKNIAIYETGGGAETVAQTTFDEMKTMSFINENSDFLPQSFQDYLLVCSSGNSLLKKKIAIIGVDDIGRKLLAKLKDKCYRLIYSGVCGEKDDLKKQGYICEPDLKRAFKVDIVSLHLGFDSGQNKDIIKFEHLDRIKKYGLLINNSRAELVGKDGLMKCLKERQDLIFIFDMFYFGGSGLYPLFDGNTGNKGNILKNILQAPNFRFTGHTAALSSETFEEYGRNLLDLIHENLADFYL